MIEEEFNAHLFQTIFYGLFVLTVLTLILTVWFGSWVAFAFFVFFDMLWITLCREFASDDIVIKVEYEYADD